MRQAVAVSSAWQTVHPLIALDCDKPVDVQDAQGSLYSLDWYSSIVADLIVGDPRHILVCVTSCCEREIDLQRVQLRYLTQVEVLKDWHRARGIVERSCRQRRPDMTWTIVRELVSAASFSLSDQQIPGCEDIEAVGNHRSAGARGRDHFVVGYARQPAVEICTVCDRDQRH